MDKTILSALLVALSSIATFAITNFFGRKKSAAEAKKLLAETEKIQAEKKSTEADAAKRIAEAENIRSDMWQMLFQEMKDKMQQGLNEYKALSEKHRESLKLEEQCQEQMRLILARCDGLVNRITELENK